MDIDFILKGLGSITPYGDTNVDNERFKNISNYGELCEALLVELINTEKDKDRHEYSMRKMGKEAEKWLEGFRDMLN